MKHKNSWRFIQALNVGTNEEIAATLNQFAASITSPAMQYLAAETGIGSSEIPPLNSPADFEHFAQTMGTIALVSAQVVGGVIGLGLTVAGTAVGIALDLAGFAIRTSIGTVKTIISLGITVAGMALDLAITGMVEGIKAVGKGIKTGAQALGKGIVKVGKAIGKLFKGKKGKKKGFMADENGNGDCCGIPIVLGF